MKPGVLGLVIIDRAGSIVAADEGVGALLGWTPEQLIGRPVIDLVPGPARGAHAEAIARYLAAPVPRTLGRRGREVRLVRKDGTEIAIAVRLLPLAGEPPTIAATAIDLDRENAEAARRRSEQHLAAAQRVTRCGSWELDLSNLGDVNANPLRWSDEVFRIFGHEPGTIDVTNENFFRAVHPDDRDRIAAAVQLALQSGTPYSIEHRVIRPDGSIRMVHEGSAIEYDGDGRPSLMIGTVQDITERKLAEEALRRAEHTAELADRMASLGMVAAGVAHEINNPLAAVMLGLELVVTKARLRPDEAVAGEALDDALLGLDRVREIVRDLRVFARADDDRRVPVDVNRVLASTLRMAAGQIRDRANLVTRFAAVPAVIATQARLGQVFLNLLLNALHAIGDDAPVRNEIVVATSTDAAGRVVVSIADTGGGIPPELQAKIFTPFFTTKDVGVGTGLGLSICHRIITGLGGDIEFTSVVGRGTEFRVTLPADAEARPSDSGQLPAAAVARRRGRVLVVDDEPAITSALVKTLGDRDDVAGVSSASEALARIAGGARFDVILCDLMMPQMTGMELHAELTRIAPDQARRLVAMTGGAFSPEAREFLAGGRLAIEKPFDLVRLEAVIAELVG
jgi:PAS domain S-box-containing protein